MMSVLEIIGFALILIPTFIVFISMMGFLCIYFLERIDNLRRDND